MAKNFRVVSLCLTDIIAFLNAGHSAFSKSPKNGKIYFNALVGDKDELDQYNQDVYVKLNPKKEFESTQGKDFLGNGRIMEAKQQAPPTAQDVAALQINEAAIPTYTPDANASIGAVADTMADDLPF